MKTKKVKKALVLWYSQTGNTQRCGIVLERTLQDKGIKTESSEIREFKIQEVINFDLLVIGSPVFYYDTPDYVKDFITSLPDLNGTPVASYVTFGGPEGNQYNANCSILELLSEKNGVPVGLNSFMSITSYPLSWSKDKVNEKTWNGRHLPDKNTFQSVRKYADFIVDQIEHNQYGQFTKKLTLRETFTFFDLEWWTKQTVKKHYIIQGNCVRCGACVEKCPTNAIDLKRYNVNTDVCVMCFGCINNCDYQAMHMEYNREKVLGFKQFLEHYDIELFIPVVRT